MSATIAILLELVLGLSAARADALPLDGEPVHFDSERTHLVAAAVAIPDERIDDWSTRRREARRRARSAAEALVHDYVDEALERAPILPPVLAALHRAVDRALSTVAVRPLADGGAVVRVRLPVAALHEAAEVPGVPW